MILGPPTYNKCKEQNMSGNFKFSNNALEILKDRYFLRDEKRNLLETTPEELFKRVANFIAQAEINYSNGDYDKYSKIFYEAMISQEFMPASPILFNADTKYPMLSSCFALPIHDSMKSILKTFSDSATIFKYGGGVGWNFSELREEDAPLSTGGKSSGVCSFITLYNQMIETIKQGGKRRGAGAAILDVEHPDIEKFINIKRDEGKWNNINISVICSDKFMDKIFNGDEKAGRLWNLIVESNWKAGDPNIIFIDTMNRFNTLPKYPITTVNPCHEICMSPYESCNLSGINLDKVLKGSKNNKRVDWDKLGRLIKLGHRFLDNNIDMCMYPIKEIKEFAEKTRRQGLYFFGLAPFLIKLGLRYGSQESLDMIDNLFCFINRVSLESCIKLGKERGNFLDFDDSIFKDKYKYMRCSNRLTIAPSGSTSRIADSYFSIEPYYAFEYESHIMDKIIKDSFSIKDEYKDVYPRALVTAHEIKPEEHLRVMATVGKWIDQSISKTVNLPNFATVEDVSKILKLSYKFGLKAIAVYRDGCKSTQVLNKDVKPAEKDGRKYIISKDLLEELYIRQKLPQHKIAKKLDVSQALIALRMKEYEIPVRVGKGKNIRFLPDIDTIKFLHNKKMSYEDISGIFGCHENTIYDLVKFEGENLNSLERSVPISLLLIEFIEGELLGDGSVYVSGKNMAVYSHASKYFEYVCWLDRIFASEGLVRSGDIGEYIHKENGATYYSYKSIACSELRVLYNRWYNSGGKQVPDNIQLTPTILRQWFIGDGSIKKDGTSVRFSVDNFNARSVEILRNEFKRIDIETTIQDKGKTIYVRKKSTLSLFEFMDKSIYSEAPCYEYKFDRLNEPMQCKGNSCEI